ncbi:MAG TPA: hypothetical protein VN028_09395 [Rhodocyclaceae bacterium]|nr:hypothetical protein [Rhodocyclaceae bacterium]
MERPDASGSTLEQTREAAVRRTVGIAALRQLRRMVDAEQADAAARKRRARILLIVILACAVATLGFLLRRSILG